jgi:hypothetical protein
LKVTAFPIMNVTVDKKRYGETPRTIELPVGTHRLELTNNDLGTESQTVTITENQTTVINKVK